MFLFMFTFTSTKCYYSGLASFFLHPLNGICLSLFFASSSFILPMLLYHFLCLCVFIIQTSHAAVSFLCDHLLPSSNYLCSGNNLFSLYCCIFLFASSLCYDIPFKIFKRKLIQILFTKLTLF